MSYFVSKPSPHFHLKWLPRFTTLISLPTYCNTQASLLPWTRCLFPTASLIPKLKFILFSSHPAVVSHLSYVRHTHKNKYILCYSSILHSKSSVWRPIHTHPPSPSDYAEWSNGPFRLQKSYERPQKHSACPGSLGLRESEGAVRSGVWAEPWVRRPAADEKGRSAHQAKETERAEEKWKRCLTFSKRYIFATGKGKCGRVG